jgi:putative Mg2+ transporter-C (MgtC) family protein
VHNAIPALDWDDNLVRLLVAAVLGGAIGFERELREREAGLRTHMLVCVGSALFTLVSAYGFRDFLTSGDPVIRADPTRISAQIVTGIGFLGAGAIIRQGLSVRGLTTAATLWVAAAIGISAGAGYYAGAVITTLVTIFALWPLRIFGYKVFERLRPAEHGLVVELKSGQSVAPLLSKLEELGADVDALELEEAIDRRIVELRLGAPSQSLIADISDLDYVVAVRWAR